MPVMPKDIHEELLKELRFRYQSLVDHLEQRELKSNKEGAGRSSVWTNPEKMCATKGNPMQIRLAVSDFTTILGEIKKLK